MNWKKLFEDRLLDYYVWSHSVVSTFVVGFSTAFLAVSGGSTIAKAQGDFPSMSMKALMTICLTGGVIEIMRFIKDNKLPPLMLERFLQKKKNPPLVPPNETP